MKQKIDLNQVSTYQEGQKVLRTDGRKAPKKWKAERTNRAMDLAYEKTHNATPEYPLYTLKVWQVLLIILGLVIAGVIIGRAL